MRIDKAYGLFSGYFEKENNASSKVEYEDIMLCIEEIKKTALRLESIINDTLQELKYIMEQTNH